MNDSPEKGDALIPSIFSDETPLFLNPAEPEIGDTVTVRLRIRKDAEVQVRLLTGYPAMILPMEKVKTDGAID